MPMVIVPATGSGVQAHELVKTIMVLGGARSASCTDADTELHLPGSL